MQLHPQTSGMAESTRSRGTCTYCGRTLTRSGMARHLPTCERRKAIIDAAERKPGTPRRFLHLQIQDAYSRDYWLHLEMDGTATLKELDSYLRAIWLECCGHMSQFSIGGWRGEEIPLKTKAERVFRPGVEVTHIYDFGTESVTLIKALDVREGKPTARRPIALMARNAPPVVPCMECGKEATHLCMECLIEYQESGALCEQHTAAHPHDGYGEPQEIVNSPRMGMCGYEGPADPPY